MTEEGKKISFGFAKTIKKPVLKNTLSQEQKKVDYIECLDDKGIKVIGEEEKKDEPLVIPLLGSETWHDRIINKIDADIFEPKPVPNEEKVKVKNDIKQEPSNKIANGNATPIHIDISSTNIKTEPVDTTTTETTLEEQAAKEIIEDLRSTGKKEESEVLTLSITEEEKALRGQEESTLEDYERIPIDAFGLAMLRGMGWQPGRGIGKNEKVVSTVIPELRPKGMGLGADKVTLQKQATNSKDKQEEEIKIKKGTYVKIISGKYVNTYGQIEGLDDDAGRLIIKMQKQTYSTNENVEKIYEIPIENIRNFSIIAHVDHGKSTLADRLLEITGAIKRNSGKQVLDTLQVEKERGITVKAQTASLTYSYKGQNYLLNLIDTPGHVDFSSEVYRSLSACQGVILLVDANDGVQAQTVANFYLAIKRELVVIPVINKIDLPTADPERVKNQLKTLFDINEKDILKISAKLGTGVDELLQAVLKRLPPPLVDRNLPFRGLIFDSWYDKYKGAVSLIYVKDGTLSVGEHITSFTNKKSYEIKELALLRPEEELVKTLFAGEVGSIKCNMRSSKEAHIGDTLYRKGHPVESLGGFTAIKPMVFAGVYPIDQSHFFTLQNAIDKLILNDSAVEVVSNSSAALGRGWRAGFLGLLHMEVFIQRLEQEYGTEPIVTAPGVTYKAKIKGHKNIVRYKGDMIAFNNPVDYPDKQITVEYYEPMIISTIITPDKYIGPVISLCLEKRGIEQYSQTIGNNRTLLKFVMPLNEVVLDFHDTLKTITSGYASFDYEDNGYHPSEIVKLNILLNSNIVEELSTIVHCTKAREVGKRMCSKLLNIIPRQLFEISIQATVGSKILARENLKAYRKDVTAKLYGGDVTRRMKLLAKQKQGKIKMRMIGNISLPRETFINVLKR